MDAVDAVNHQIGIDFATIDGNKPINWPVFRAAGGRFAIVRAAQGIYMDRLFTVEAPRARGAGIVVGGYALWHPKTSATSQVNCWREAIALGGNDARDLNLMIDVEFPQSRGGITGTGYTRAELGKRLIDVIAEVDHVFGAPPILYSSARVLVGTDSDSITLSPTFQAALRECPLALARYPMRERTDALGNDPDELARVDRLDAPPCPDAWGWWAIHQYQGDALNMDGATSTVDMDRFRIIRADGGPAHRWVQRRIGSHADAVQRFQSDRKLVADGVIGIQTFAALSRCRPVAEQPCS